MVLDANAKDEWGWGVMDGLVPPSLPRNTSSPMNLTHLTASPAVIMTEPVYVVHEMMVPSIQTCAVSSSAAVMVKV